MSLVMSIMRAPPCEGILSYLLRCAEIFQERGSSYARMIPLMRWDCMNGHPMFRLDFMCGPPARRGVRKLTAEDE
jgi:hypothetical protein